MNHLLNICPYTAQIWDQAALIMRTSDRLRDSIIDTLVNWRDVAFHSPFLNRIWQLLPGFILWQIWKERNRRLFRNLSLPWQQCWQQCRRSILETLYLRTWSSADLACPSSELPILRHWTPPHPPPAPPPPPFLPSPITAAPHSGPLLRRILSNSTLMEPLKAILEQLAMEWFSVIILDTSLSSERAPLDTLQTMQQNSGV
jgi:hypothetical protein